MGQPGGGKNDKKLFDRIMPRMFRPIAPKPVPLGSEAAAGKQVPYVRTKRKYVKKIKSVKNNGIVKEGGGKRDVTLEFADDGLESPASGWGSSGEGSSTMWNCAPEQPPPPPQTISIYPHKSADDPTVRSLNGPRRVVASWLEVYLMEETVPGHGINIRVLCGNTDREKIMNLQNDTCPVLVSDCEQTVKYMNLAYKKLVDVGDDEEEEGGRPLVSIVLKEKVPETWRAFTCIGAVVYILGKKKQTKTMPCDVWRLDFGGFLWRLDPEAALKLGQ